MAVPIATLQRWIDARNADVARNNGWDLAGGTDRRAR